jgi:type IV pilus assembly protein PilB
VSDQKLAPNAAQSVRVPNLDQCESLPIHLINADEAPVIQFVNKILYDAIKQGSSDIHFEPFEQEYRIRYRQDGLLLEVATPPVNLALQLTARIKIMANLDISERRLPQDGGFKMKLTNTKAIDFRVSTCPTADGEEVVLRILDANVATADIDSLGFSPEQQKLFIKALNRPQGMILVTGPTGSGKTVTLYSALNRLNTKEVNIVTAEDPVEMKLTGINQVTINPKAGLTFSGILRSLLRQDPDIIMVGEIRDLETAEIAVNAAQTGHLVFSTLHTNSAAETINRLVNMGIPTFNIASSISLIIAQRLARKLCDHCKKVRNDYSRTALLELGLLDPDLNEQVIYKPVGCAQCSNGYRGQVALFELLPMTNELGQLIMSGGNALELFTLAKTQGMITLFESGLTKVKQGITTLEELNRVTIN